MGRSDRARPRRLSRAEKKAETRAHLLAAAARVFPRAGYHGATVEQIAEEAGYSHGAVYSNFSGKEEIFLELAEQYAQERARETAAAHSEDRGFEAQARGAADVWMERVFHDPASVILRLEFAMHAARHPELREAFARRERGMSDLLERLIGEHPGDEALPVSPRELAVAVRAMGIGLAVEALVDPETVRSDLYGDMVVLLSRLIARGSDEGPPDVDDLPRSTRR